MRRAAAEKIVGLSGIPFVVAVLALLPATPTAGAAPLVTIATSLGDIQVELLPERAPRTVENFLAYAAAGHYDGTIFHRVVHGVFVQGGGLTPDLRAKPTRPPIPNEAANGLENRLGTLAMMRRRDPDSATAQFLINVQDNPFLDHAGETPAKFGYAVFGRVVAGMDVVRAIAALPTGPRGMYLDVPLEPPVIRSVRVVDAGR